MGYDLSNDNGDYFRFNIHGWRPILTLAKKYGWVPAQTVKRVNKSWSGSYYSNDGQKVTAKDAAAIADALEKALPYLSENDLSPKMVTFRHDMPSLNDKNEYESIRRIMDISSTVKDEDISLKKYGHNENEWYPGKKEQAPYILIVISDDMNKYYQDEDNQDPENTWSGANGIKRVKDFIIFCRKGSFYIY